MKELLEKTRRISQLVSKSTGHPPGFEDIARMLCDLTGANTYIADRSGSILGYALIEGFECQKALSEMLECGEFPVEFNERLVERSQTTANLRREDEAFKDGEPCAHENEVMTIVPISGGGERLGTLVMARDAKEFGDEDLLLAEYGATVVAMELLRSQALEREEEARQRTAVQVALNTLSYSELEAVQHIFDELEGTEGLLVASRVADRVGITRSVIVNALRKFESAGVIESRSLGMKGTHIKILNDRLLPELERLRR